MDFFFHDRNPLLQERLRTWDLKRLGKGCTDHTETYVGLEYLFGPGAGFEVLGLGATAVSVRGHVPAMWKRLLNTFKMQDIPN